MYQDTVIYIHNNNYNNTINTNSIIIIQCESE